VRWDNFGDGVDGGLHRSVVLTPNKTKNNVMESSSLTSEPPSALP